MQQHNYTLKQEETCQRLSIVVKEYYSSTIVKPTTGSNYVFYLTAMASAPIVPTKESK